MSQQSGVIEKEERFAIDLVRVVACFLIYLCHAFGASNTRLGGMFGMLFNVGVPIFYMLSGYLYSGKAKPRSIGKWYWDQGKKLLIPLWLFLMALLVSHILGGVPLSGKKWLHNALPMAGLTEQYLPGCTHLWYITHICVCYLITPFLMQWKRPGNLWLLLAAYLAVKLVGAYTIPPIFCTLLASLGSYAFGFYFLPRLKQWYAKLVYLMPVAAVLRIVCKLLLDGSPLYDLFLVDLCHKLLALSIIAFVYLAAKRLGRYAGVATATKTLSAYTYEMYLVHHPILIGPVALTVTGNAWIIGIVGFGISAVCAWGLHKANQWTRKQLERGRCTWQH